MHGTRKREDVSVHYHCCVSIRCFAYMQKYSRTLHLWQNRDKRTGQLVATKARPNLKYAQCELDQAKHKYLVSAVHSLELTLAVFSEHFVFHFGVRSGRLRARPIFCYYIISVFWFSCLVICIC